ELSNTQTLYSIECGNTLALRTFSDLAEGSAFVPLTKWRWYFLAIAWVYTPGSYDAVEYRAYIMSPDGPLEPFGKPLIAGGMQGGILVVGGQKSITGNIAAQQRYGAPGLYQIRGFEDVAVPPDLIAPPFTPSHWFVNPATGDDSHDGTTPSTAWRTVAAINRASAFLGMLPHEAGYEGGDTLHLDCSGAPLAIGPQPLEIRTCGLNILQTGGPLDPMTTLAPSGWTPAGAGVYSTTDGNASDLRSVVLFEEGRYLAHPLGNQYEAVAAALASTPGSFWTDGVRLWVHPFGSTDPRSDGKRYRRTRNRGNAGSGLNAGLSAVLIVAPHNSYEGLEISGTTLTTMETDDPVGSYAIQYDQNAGGINRLVRFRINHYSKHAVGWTANGSNAVLERIDGEYGQRAPYAPGGATTDVDFTGNPAVRGNIARYIRCRETRNLGVIGSSEGTVDHALQSWTSHASGKGWSLIGFYDCDFLGFLEDQGVSDLIEIVNTRCAFAGANGNLMVLGSTAFRGAFGATGTGSAIIRESVIRPGPSTGFFYASLPATAIIERCLIDWRGCPAGAGVRRAVWHVQNRTGAALLAIRNVMLVEPRDDFTLIDGYGAASHLAMSENRYRTGDGGYVVRDYHDGAATRPRTFAEWQALGFDSTSEQISAETHPPVNTDA
ncbi:MAG: hypothetical protein V4710_09735, partial [Verrucomicrobiota bacterium]